MVLMMRATPTNAVVEAEVNGAGTSNNKRKRNQPDTSDREEQAASAVQLRGPIAPVNFQAAMGAGRVRVPHPRGRLEEGPGAPLIVAEPVRPPLLRLSSKARREIMEILNSTMQGGRMSSPRRGVSPTDSETDSSSVVIDVAKAPPRVGLGIDLNLPPPPEDF